MMKKYKENEKSCFYNKNDITFYEINYYKHGLYYYSLLNNNDYIHKGYYNMDEEYGHWINYKWDIDKGYVTIFLIYYL